MAQTKSAARSKMAPESSPKKSKASPKRSPKSKAKSPKKSKASPKRLPKSKASPKKSPKKSPVKRSSPKSLNRTNIDSITDPALKRLARVGGVPRIASDAYPEIRKIIVKDLNDLMHAAVVFAEHEKRKIVNLNDIKHAYTKVTGGKLVYGTPTGEMCKKHQRVVSSKRKAKIAISEIKHYQSQKGCFMLPSASFNRLAKEAMHKYGKDSKVNKDAITMAHFLVEQHIINVFEDSLLCALAAKRRGVKLSDIKLVMKIRRE